MADNFKIISDLDISFKEFMPGQVIQSAQFNDDMKDIEEKVNEVIGQHNEVASTVVDHLNNKNNPHEVTAHQVGAYTVEEADELYDDLREGNFNDGAITNRVLGDGCVNNRVIEDRTITAIKVEDGFGHQIDISENIEITDRYTKNEVDELVRSKVGEGAYTKEEIDQKFQEFQSGQIIDKTISADKVTSDFGDNIDISNNPSIESRYTKGEVDMLIAMNGLPKDWGNISDEPIDVESGIGSLPVAGNMVAGQFVSPATSVLDIDVKENVEARGEYNSVGERLNGVDSQIKNIEARIDNLGESGASGVSIQDTANNFTSTNVEGALAELFQFVNTVAEELRQISSGGTGEQPLYKFGLLSDVHVDGDGTDTAYSISDLNNAIQYFNNENCKFIVYCGDVTENGRSEDYTALKSCLATSSIPNYSVRGNHDMTNGYSEATGCADDYTITQNNDLFIFLSPSANSGTLSDDKLNWLENLLTTNTDKRIFFIYHFFFNNTAGNACNLDNGGLPSSNVSVIRLKAMIESYSNLIFCNGHSHLRFNLQDLDPNANYYHEDGKCYYVHVPSVSRPRDDNGSGGTTNIYGGSEGYLVEVYANKVIFKPIDFISSEYLTKYNYTANVAQGNNAPTIPTEPPESSSGVITPTWSTGNINYQGVDNDGDTSAMRTDHMAFDTNSYNYYITVSSDYEGIQNIKLYYYNFDSSFNSRKAYSTSELTAGVPSQITFPTTLGTFRVKTDFGTTNTLENIKDRLIVTKVAKNK